jgi:hypothetical protein
VRARGLVPGCRWGQAAPLLKVADAGSDYRSMSHGTSIALAALAMVGCGTLFRRTIREMLSVGYGVDVGGGFVILIIVEFVGMVSALSVLVSLV